ncbi:MAG TPA: hypothetical protein VL443_13735, partial [Cyclobacteriaceae bacterium]|nr:hypothetical protein [Cyclobacteriaceae bacterium]
MKNKNIGLKLMTLMLLVLSSCSDFLNQKPQTAFTQEEVFADLDKIEPLILGMYTSWRNSKKDRDGFIVMLGTDESQQGTQQVTSDADQGGLDKYDGFLAPSNKSLEHQWELRWPIISTASSTIYALKANKQDPARRDLLLGDASFIRAALS